MKVIDTHAHFWDVEARGLRGSIFDKTFSLVDYQRASAEVPINQMIFVEAGAHSTCSLHEAQWVQRLAAVDRRIQGIVAGVALSEKATLHADLDAAAAIPLVKGMRDNIQSNPPGFAIQTSFIEVVKELGRTN
jgi:L-fuconolactonase